MSNKIVNREELKQHIIQAYYRNNTDFDVLDLEGKASDLEEPFKIEFNMLIEQYKKTGSSSVDGNTESELLEIEDIEELNEEAEVVDIDVLNKIEDVVIRTLQYLNLELYDNNKIKDFITSITLDDFQKTGISCSMQNRIESVIKNLVDHEFKQLDTKREFRRESLIRDSASFFAEKINIMLANHEQNSSGKLTPFQIRILKHFIYDTIIADQLELFKKTNKLNYEELRFVDNFIKKLIVLLINKYISKVKTSSLD